MNEIYAFEVTVKGMDWQRTINARTRGKAKSAYHLDLSDPWPNIPFTALRCRKIGPTYTSKAFVQNARYRGLPGARCGQRVKVGDAYGSIVGHNASANFDVLFDEGGKYGGLTLNCHPDSCEFIAELKEIL